MLQTTVMCLSIGTPINNKFSICSKWKIYYFRCPKIWAHNSLITMYLNIGTRNNHHSAFETNGKVVVLDVPILKHFSVPIQTVTTADLSFYDIYHLHEWIFETLFITNNYSRWM